MLTRANLGRYLLSLGMIQPGAIADGDFLVTEASRRHLAFRVQTSPRGYFVKQARPGDADAARWLRREAEVYRILHTRPELAAAARRTPRLLAYDAAREIMSLELLTGYRSLAELPSGQGAHQPAVAARLGGALRDFHRPEHGQAARDDPQIFAASRPWIFGLGDGLPGMGKPIGPANRSLIGIVQGEASLREGLEALKSSWSPDSLVHGDMKWDNCLVAPGGEEVRFVDLELADRGDPLWDVAGVLHAYLGYWLYGAGVDALTEPGARSALAEASLEAARPAIRAFLEAYFGDAAGARNRGALAFRYAAGRLLQAVYEASAAAAALNAQAILMLQLAANIFALSDEAAWDLLA
jgi:hypothetical protein